MKLTIIICFTFLWLEIFALRGIQYRRQRRRQQEILRFETSFQGPTGQNGNMFDIQVLHSDGITIMSMDLHLKSNKEVVEGYQIYVREGGSFSESEMPWVMLGCARMISNGPYTPSALPSGGMRRVSVEKDGILGIYVTLTTNPSSFLNYSYGDGIVGHPSNNYVNEDIQLFEV